MLGVFVTPEDKPDRMRTVLNFPKDWPAQKCKDHALKELKLVFESQPDVNEPTLVAQMPIDGIVIEDENIAEVEGDLLPGDDEIE